MKLGAVVLVAIRKTRHFITILTYLSVYTYVPQRVRSSRYNMRQYIESIVCIIWDLDTDNYRHPQIN